MKTLLNVADEATGSAPVIDSPLVGDEGGEVNPSPPETTLTDIESLADALKILNKARIETHATLPAAWKKLLRISAYVENCQTETLKALEAQ